MRAFRPLVLLLFAVAACDAGPSTAPAPNTIIIASDLPTSAFGHDARQAQQAIAFAIHQQGTIGGFTLEYWPFDDSLSATPNPIRGVENVERMVGEPRVVGMIGPFASGVATYEIPVGNSSDLVMVSPSNTNNCLTLALPSCDTQPRSLRPSGTNNYFRIAAPDPLQGRAMARYATNKLGATRVAAFNEWGPDGDLIVKEFSTELKRLGGAMVLEQDLDAGTNKFDDFLRAAKASGAEAVYAVGSASDHICLARAQMSVLLPQAYFLTVDGTSTDAEHCLSDTGDNTTRMYGTLSDVDPKGGTDPNVLAYLKAHPKASDVGLYTFAAYDCAGILMAAIGAAIAANHGSFPTRPEVLDRVAHTSAFKGTTGTYTFDVNGDATSPLMSIYQLRGGTWVYVQPIDVSAHS